MKSIVRASVVVIGDTIALLVNTLSKENKYVKTKSTKIFASHFHPVLIILVLVGYGRYQSDKLFNIDCLRRAARRRLSIHTNWFRGPCLPSGNWTLNCLLSGQSNIKLSPPQNYKIKWHQSAAWIQHRIPLNSNYWIENWWTLIGCAVTQRLHIIQSWILVKNKTNWRYDLPLLFFLLPLMTTTILWHRIKNQ